MRGSKLTRNSELKNELIVKLKELANLRKANLDLKDKMTCSYKELEVLQDKLNYQKINTAKVEAEIESLESQLGGK